MDLAQWTTRAPVAWAVLVTAGMLEVVWLVALKRSVSATQPFYGVASVAVAWLSFALLAVTLRTIPAGTAYAVWTGVGAAGGAVAGVLLFGESLSVLRLLSVTLIVIGVVGVKLAP
jgi:quaternary ammonium compound-resistance protein SugE